MEREIWKKSQNLSEISLFINYADRSTHRNDRDVKGPSIGTRDSSERNDAMIKDSIARSSRRRRRSAARVLMEMRIPGPRNTTNIQDDRPGPEELNGHAFRDCEFFTRIIRLRQDPSIRYGEGKILFSSRREHETLRISARRQTHGISGLPGFSYEIISTFMRFWISLFWTFLGMIGQS